MKVICNCAGCGYHARISVDREPRFCPQCGSAEMVVTKETPKSRITAEAKMAELDVLRPRLEAAWDEYSALRSEYEDLMQFLVVYKRRGIVSDEEWTRYRIDWKTKLNEELKKYRDRKRGEVV